MKTLFASVVVSALLASPALARGNGDASAELICSQHCYERQQRCVAQKGNCGQKCIMRCQEQASQCTQACAPKQAVPEAGVHVNNSKGKRRAR